MTQTTNRSVTRQISTQDAAADPSPTLQDDPVAALADQGVTLSPQATETLQKTLAALSQPDAGGSREAETNIKVVF
jgi:hypothetical protein